MLCIGLKYLTSFTVHLLVRWWDVGPAVVIVALPLSLTDRMCIFLRYVVIVIVVVIVVIVIVIVVVVIVIVIVFVIVVVIIDVIVSALRGACKRPY